MAGWLYSLAAHLLRLAAWPTLWWLGRSTPAFRQRWGERRGRVALPAAVRGGVVVHAVSMGEVAAATPLVEALLAERPELPLVFTCTTPTASTLIQARFGTRVHHCYLPFDTPGAIRRFLTQAAPRLLVLMETELWPNLLRQAQAQGTAVVLAGARLSERSARRYARWPALTGPLLAHIDLLLVQDEAAAERFVRLGAAPARLRVTGSPKFDTPPAGGSEALRARFLACTAGRRVWVAASTHDGEEEALLDALAGLRERWPDLLLVLVPRHPQRFDAVAAVLDRRGLRWQRRSQLGDAGVCEAQTAVLLGDTMGELRSWFGVAEVTFIGGTLIERGGHSPLEAMPLGTPIVCGPHVFNFAELFAALRAADGVAMVPDAAALGPTMASLLADPAAALAMGERGRALYDSRRGASERSVALMLTLLQGLPPIVDVVAPQRALRADVDRFAQPTAARLDPACWPMSEPITDAGRGSAWFVEDETGAYVLRHYQRGGFFGDWLRDRYLHRRVEDSRGLAEFALLRRMRMWGLRVPRPVAAAVRRSGLVDRCDILVERIAGAQDVARLLQQGPLAAAQWTRIGAAIGTMHGHGVNHRDLNCRNLLLDAAGAAWIIDFDRCLARAPGPWVASNLARLRHSLRREGERSAQWHWDEAGDWSRLLAGHTDALAQVRRIPTTAPPIKG